MCKFEDLGCTRKYVYIRGKRDHEKKCTYNPVKPQPQFECEECGRKYFDKRIRDRNLREVHKIKSSVVVTPASVEDPGQGEFQCDQCSRRFLDKNHLNAHINRVHRKKGKRTVQMMLKIVQPSTGGAQLSFVNARPSFCTASYTILTSFLFVRFLLSWCGYVRPSFFIVRTLLLIVRPSLSTVRHRSYQTLRTPPCGHVRLSFCKVRPSLGIVWPSLLHRFSVLFVNIVYIFVSRCLLQHFVNMFLQLEFSVRPEYFVFSVDMFP